MQPHAAPYVYISRTGRVALHPHHDILEVLGRAVPVAEVTIDSWRGSTIRLHARAFTTPITIEFDTADACGDFGMRLTSEFGVPMPQLPPATHAAAASLRGPPPPLVDSTTTTAPAHRHTDPASTVASPYAPPCGNSSSGSVPSPYATPAAASAPTAEASAGGAPHDKKGSGVGWLKTGAKFGASALMSMGRKVHGHMGYSEQPQQPQQQSEPAPPQHPTPPAPAPAAQPHMQALQREREQLEAQLREEQAQAQAPAYPAAPSQPPPPPAAGGTADDDDADDPQFAAELLAAIQASAAAAPPPATTVLPPTVDMTQVPTEAELEGYIEGNVLGAGGQGSLTIGYTRDRRKAFVIKKIPCRSVDECDQVYIRAITLSMTLSENPHPGIIKYLKVEQRLGEDPAVVILMPAFNEGDLEGVLRGSADEKPSEPRITSYVQQIADALQYLHGLTIERAGRQVHMVHRDLKPANVLLSQGRTRCTLIDFDSWGRTGRSACAGTAEYAAPEYAATGEATPKSDIWSLGAILFTLLAWNDPMVKDPDDGQETFLSHPTFANFEKLRYAVTQAVQPHHRGTPLLELCLAMLHADPAQRPSASDVLRRCAA